MDGKRLPPTPFHARKRIFAHVLMVDVACPNCGRLHAGAAGHTNRNLKVRKRRAHLGGYDYLTGVFTCRTPGCRKKYLVGVVLYPVGIGQGTKRPRDTQPSLSEATELREQASHTALDPLDGPLANWVGSEEADEADRRPTGRPASPADLVAGLLKGESPE